MHTRRRLVIPSAKLGAALQHVGAILLDELLDLAGVAHESVEEAASRLARDYIIRVVVAHAARQLLVGHAQAVLLQAPQRRQLLRLHDPEHLLK